MRSKTFLSELTEQNALDAVQARYLEALDAESNELDSAMRRTFLEDAAEVLAERPSQDWEEITEALSPPASFAAAWIGEHPTRAESNTLRKRLRRPRNLLLLAVAILVAIGGGWTYSYYTEQPRITNNCRGANGPSVEQLEAAGSTEYIMPFEMDARYGIGLCIGAFDDHERVALADVIIERVYLADSILFPVQPVGWEIIDFDSDRRGDATQNQSFNTRDQQGLTNITVWFEGDRCNSSNAGIGFGPLSVDYTYRGRQRTTTIDMRAQYTFWFEEGQCTAARAADTARDDAWRSVTSGRLELGENFDTRSVQLEPLAVSRDLCRYLRGIVPPEHSGAGYEVEALESRTVFQLDPAQGVPLIDGAVLGICPDFADQRDALVEIVQPTEQ